MGLVPYDSKKWEKIINNMTEEEIEKEYQFRVRLQERIEKNFIKKLLTKKQRWWNKWKHY